METEIMTPEQNKLVINNMPIYIRSVDRTMKAVGDWWNALQSAESVYFPNRSDLDDILSTVEIDGHLSGIIDKRIKTVANKKMYFKGKDGKKIDALDDLAKLENFKDLRKKRFSKVFRGLFGVEFIPGAEFEYKIIPRKHINPVEKLITKEQWGNDGFKYEGIWNIIILGERDDFGLMNKCAPYALWKKGVMGDWAQFIEIFGQPFIMFLYNGYDEKTKKEVDAALERMGGGTKMQLPKEVEPKVFDAKGSNGDGNLQDKFRIACNQEMSVIILGATETTTSSSSSGHAQSNEHGKQQDEIIIDDMSDELNFFNSKQFLAIQKSYGFASEGEWCYEEEVDIDKVKKKVDIIMTVSKRQPVGDDYVYEVSGIPKPDNYYEERKKMDERSNAMLNNGPGDNDDDPAVDPPKNKKPVKEKKKLAAQALAWWNGFVSFFGEAR